MSKPTFKREKRETGLAGVGRPHPDVQIKMGGKHVGTIYAPTWRDRDNKWSVAVMVVCRRTEEVLRSGEWHWVFFKARHDSEEEAREWVRRSWPRIEEMFVLHQIDE